jgi:TPR repeat protein
MKCEKQALGTPQFMASCSLASLLLCFQPDEAASMLHFFFGSKGGDALSRMALGYRHMYGVGVPRSCPTAVAYYQPVAELVSTLTHLGPGWLG